MVSPDLAEAISQAQTVSVRRLLQGRRTQEPAMIRTALYSLWSKPMQGGSVGYSSTRTLLESWGLSVCLAAHHFDRVVLFTDTEGWELLGKLNLPFSIVDTSLLEEKMKGVNPAHWALAKLAAIQAMQEPFVHLDGDVFLFKQLPDWILEADACFQQYEGNEWSGGYEDLRTWSKQLYNAKTTFFDNQEAYNCGIVGFNDLRGLDEWYQQARNWIVKFDKLGVDHARYCTGLLFEQMLVAAHVQQYNKQVRLLSSYGPDPQQLDDKTAQELGYVHLMAESKRQPMLEKLVRNKLKSLYPNLYYQIAHYYEA